VVLVVNYELGSDVIYVIYVIYVILLIMYVKQVRVGACLKRRKWTLCKHGVYGVYGVMFTVFVYSAPTMYRWDARLYAVCVAPSGIPWGPV